ncbi:hypothetical protein DFH08DRAFT_945352 [Mycena albidolilacea]|uniref:Uncharacterized protein n=1 Tax=Mycena albidolilacea TaxID=1033008 RepID=A0AAD7E9P8_9AGAR|nr:hypothetical protein DFH08DRAFT_945352 [Mycena albidolilacea]
MELKRERRNKGTVHRYTKNNGGRILGCEIQQNLPVHNEDPEGKQCEGSGHCFGDENRSDKWVLEPNLTGRVKQSGGAKKEHRHKWNFELNANHERILTFQEAALGVRKDGSEIGSLPGAKWDLSPDPVFSDRLADEEERSSVLIDSKDGSVVRIWGVRVKQKVGERECAVWARSTGGGRKDSVRAINWSSGVFCSLATYPRWGTQVTGRVDGGGSNKRPRPPSTMESGFSWGELRRAMARSRRVWASKPANRRSCPPAKNTLCISSTDKSVRGCACRLRLRAPWSYDAAALSEWDARDIHGSGCILALQRETRARNVLDPNLGRMQARVTM